MHNNPTQMEHVEKRASHLVLFHQQYSRTCILTFDGLFMSILTFKDLFETGAFGKKGLGR